MKCTALYLFLQSTTKFMKSLHSFQSFMILSLNLFPAQVIAVIQFKHTSLAWAPLDRVCIWTLVHIHHGGQYQHVWAVTSAVGQCEQFSSNLTTVLISTNNNKSMKEMSDPLKITNGPFSIATFYSCCHVRQLRMCSTRRQ